MIPTTHLTTIVMRTIVRIVGLEAPKQQTGPTWKHKTAYEFLGTTADNFINAYASCIKHLGLAFEPPKQQF